MKTPLRLGIAALILLASLVSQVQAALIFDFSIINTIGTVSGTVQGEILGLSDNSTGPASQVLITSFPAGLNSIAGSTPINAMLWDQQNQNSFTVVNGQVVSGGFWAQQTINGFPQGFQLYINGDGGPFNFVNLDGDDHRYVWGDNGLGAAHIVAEGEVPDSASTLGITVLALVGLLTFRFVEGSRAPSLSRLRASTVDPRA